MHLSLPLTLLPTLSLLITPLLAVDITLRFADNHPFPAMVQMQAQVCRNIPPGRCCQGRPAPNLPGLAPPGGPFQNYRVAEFSALMPLDIASAWIPQGDVGGCSGVPVATHPGPGYWKFPDNGNSPNIITGGSYLRVPTRLPANEGESAMCEAEGILGTVTGGGKWVSSSATTNLLRQAADAALKLTNPGTSKRRRSGAGAGVMRKRDLKRRLRTKRGIIIGEPGFLWAQPPAKSTAVWPDVLVFSNGKNYSLDTPGRNVYHSEDGQVIDFSKAAG